VIGSRKIRREQIESVFQLVGPMGEMIEKMHEVVLAHHPAGFTADDCPVCAAYQAEMEPILERWGDVRAKVLEHWDV
jgi:hypothetical protein